MEGKDVMAVMSLEELYEQVIKPLSAEERLKLIVMTAQELSQSELRTAAPKRSIMELHGLGKELWQDIDAQKFADALRGEWDHCPRLNWIPLFPASRSLDSIRLRSSISSKPSSTAPSTASSGAGLARATL